MLIDDASTDGSLKIAEDFAQRDRRIRILNQEVNPPLTVKLGVAKARNLGLDAARGKYIMWCDSDDYYELNMVERMVKTMEDNPKADLACCSVAVHDGTRKDDGFREYVKLRNFGLLYITDELRADESSLLMNKIFRRRVFEDYKIRILNSTQMSEDESLVCKYLLVSAKIYHVQSKLYNYVLRGDSATHKHLMKLPQMASAYLQNISDIADFMDTYSLWTEHSNYFSAKLRWCLWMFPNVMDNVALFYPAARKLIELAYRVKSKNISDLSLRRSVLDFCHGVVKTIYLPAEISSERTLARKCISIVFLCDETRGCHRDALKITAGNLTNCRR